MLPNFFKTETDKEKSVKQEKKSAKQHKGRLTINSGSLYFDKADVCIPGKGDVKNIRLELKRTDKRSMNVKKEWIEKLQRETKVQEVWALELEIDGCEIVCISKLDFEFYKHFILEGES